MSGKFLDIYEFGTRLLETEDLDPVYVVLHKASLTPLQLRRWLLAYWCFYHMGTASWITDQPRSYWERMWVAAKSKDYPRGRERRHFRGANAEKSIVYLEDRGIPDLFNCLVGQEASTSCETVMREVQTWVGFGPWISFKVADMLERLGVANVDFTGGEMFLFDSPRQGAEMLWAHEKEDEEDIPDSVGPWAVNQILSRLETNLAPPKYERAINGQEAETILCKWKAYMNGHYHVGEDIQACKIGLLRPTRYALASLNQHMYAAGRRAQLW